MPQPPNPTQTVVIALAVPLTGGGELTGVVMCLLCLLATPPALQRKKERICSGHCRISSIVPGTQLVLNKCLLTR